MTTPLYQILYDTGIDILADKVNNHMRKGWIPLGGMAVHRDFFYQAMTKPAPNPHPTVAERGQGKSWGEETPDQLLTRLKQSAKPTKQSTKGTKK